VGLLGEAQLNLICFSATKFYLCKIKPKAMLANLRSAWKKIDQRIPTPMRNKFVLVTTIFVLWMLFLDKNSILLQYNLQNTIKELQSKKKYYQQELKQTEKDYNELFANDDLALEKFAREHYLMKKDDEEIFVVEK
jgi:cell division protein FtsB